MQEMRLIVLAAGVDPHALLKSERTRLTCADGEVTVAKAVLLGVKWFNNCTRKGLKEGDGDIELLDFDVKVVEDWALLRCGIVPKDPVSRAHYKALKRLADYVGDGEVMVALCWSRQLYKALLCEVDAAGIERRLRRLEKKGDAYQPLVASILDSDRADYHKAIVRRIGEVNEGWEGNLLESAKLGITAACYEWARKEIEEQGDRKQALAFLEKAVKRGYPGAEALKTHTVLGGLEREVALKKLATSGCPYAHFYLGHYKTAADGGMIEACYTYALECGGEERLKYLRKGAKGGHGDACFLLAMEWKQDRVKHREAIRLLEMCDTISDEVRAEELYQIWKSPRNNRRSRKSLTLASDFGHPLAKAHLVLRICCSKEVTAEDLVEGEELVTQIEEARPGLAALCRLCLSKFHDGEVVPQFIEDNEVDCELGYRFGQWCVDNDWAPETGAACLVKGMSDPDPYLAWRSLWYFIRGDFGEEVSRHWADQLIAAARLVLHHQNASFRMALSDWLWGCGLEEGRALAEEVWELLYEQDGRACYRLSQLRNDPQLLKHAALELNSVDAILHLCQLRMDGQKLVDDSSLYQSLWTCSLDEISPLYRERIVEYLATCRLNGIGVKKAKRCVIC